MVRSRAVLATLVVALAGSIGWGWRSGARVAARIPAVVTRVVDGDTIVVAIRGRSEKVRILGANTPETVDPRKPVECFGPQASAYTHRRLAPGTRVSLETDAQMRDAYGRLLAYVYVGGARFDDELLRQGYARLLIIPPNGVHARALLEAELAARAAGRGLWSAC
ncbi:MAG TPA: thermonuclease family protein [Acidimicrobiia bacterium]|nr:thermonuclease family protein [Acidimicrobiia bacterium]